MLGGPAKWAFSRKASRSKSVEFGKGSPSGRVSYGRWPPARRPRPRPRCEFSPRSRRCRSPEQEANKNSSRNRPPFPRYGFHWTCNSNYARRWCSGCEHWPRWSARRTSMNKITADHLARRACVYIRQSTPGQVQHNLESKRGQYALADRAKQLGWDEVEIIDDDLGRSGTGTHRPGFERLLGSLCDGKVGAVFSIEAS